jgi:hypothetical protein
VAKKIEIRLNDWLVIKYKVKPNWIQKIILNWFYRNA